jgi:hypothetical protein
MPRDVLKIAVLLDVKNEVVTASLPSNVYLAVVAFCEYAQEIKNNQVINKYFVIIAF